MSEYPSIDILKSHDVPKLLIIGCSDAKTGGGIMPQNFIPCDFGEPMNMLKAVCHQNFEQK